MNTKSEIRKEILSIRNNIDKSDTIKKSDIIIKKLKETLEYKNSTNIMVYMDFNNEVNTKIFIEEALKEGKNIIIPYTDMEKVEIIPVQIKGFDDLEICKFGYLEPKKEKIKYPFDIKNVDLIVVPGVAFDKLRNRIGFGKGYYDKLLIQKNTSTKAIAIAYEFQVLDSVPAEVHDIKMDKIITEENIYF